MIGRTCMPILQKIRNHPNQDRAHAVARDLIAGIAAGEPLESLETIYHEDLELMRKGERKMELFDIGTEIDNARGRLDNAGNLLILFNESMEQELDVLKEGDCWARHVYNRSPLLSSLLDAIQEQVRETMAMLADLSNSVHAEWKEEKLKSAGVSQE